ncbi:MAG: class I SAM-dependent methyltransferase [Lachnospiraceae bacterium]|nr:class I SAM-dependent methyltransferase [Lachnospiraceae bacterium]
MGGLRIEENRFVYVDAAERTVLLDCNDLIENYSRLPLQYLPEGECLPRLILDGIKEHGIIATGTKEEQADKEYATIEMLVAKEHMKTPHEIKVLEIGCTSGILSYHLAKLMGKYHAESQLCCVTDTIGNESGNGWIDKIALLGEAPRLSFLATDYDCMPLPDGYFDVVVINGSVSFLQKEEMLSEAVRVLKEDGVLIAYVVEDVDLIQRIASKSLGLDSYMYLEDRCVLKVAAQQLQRKLRRGEEKSYVREDVKRICEELVREEATSEQLREMIRMLDRFAGEAEEVRDPESKVFFMQYKGKMLDELVKKKPCN